MNLKADRQVVLTRFEVWLSSQIDSAVCNKVAAKYLKNALHNYLCANEKTIHDSMDAITMFVADEDGNVDTNTFARDVIDLFANIDGNSMNLGFLNLTVVSDGIEVSMPDNDIIRLLLGSTKYHFSNSDVQELISAL